MILTRISQTLLLWSSVIFYTIEQTYVNATAEKYFEICYCNFPGNIVK